MTRFRGAKVCNDWLQMKIGDHRIQSDYKYRKWTTKSRRKELYTGYCLCVLKSSTTPMTTWPPRPTAPYTQRTWTSTPELMHAWSHAHSPVVRFWSSWFAHHIVAQVSIVRVISWSLHDERISSTLSPPFPSTSSSSHSSVNSIPPIQRNSIKNGYDENNNYNKTNETKCETNYSIITKVEWREHAH